MPKGRVPERECTCRACGETFRTDMPGKAAWFCRSAACDAARGVKARSAYVPLAQRDPQAAAKRKQAQQDARRTAKRNHRVGVAGRAAARLLPRVTTARAEYARLLGELRDEVAIVHELGGQVPDEIQAIARPAASPAPPAPAPAPPPVPASGKLADRIAQLQQDVGRLHLERAEQLGDDPLTFRRLTARAMRQVGTATGATGTADALYRLAVVALAWESHLRRSAREVRQEAADA